MREGLLLHSGSVVTHQLLERLVQAGGGQAADHAGQDGAGVDGGPAGPAGQGNAQDRKSTRLNSSHLARSRMPSSA